MEQRIKTTSSFRLATLSVQKTTESAIGTD